MTPKIAIYTENQVFSSKHYRSFDREFDSVAHCSRVVKCSSINRPRKVASCAAKNVNSSLRKKKGSEAEKEKAKIIEKRTNRTSGNLNR